MKLLSLFGAGFAMSMQRTVTFRINLLFDIVVSIIGLGSTLATVFIVFARTDSLAGWSEAQAYVLIGTYQLLSSLKSAFIDPNLSWFPENGIRQGKLDTYLLQPAPTLFLASLARSTPLALLQFVLGLGVLALGLDRHGQLPGHVAIAAWLITLAAGLAVTWAMGVLLACLAFWAPRLQLDVFYSSAWQLARFPTDIYRRPLRLVLTYLFPLTLIATIPTTTLLSGPRLPVLAATVAGAALACALAVGCWRLGLRRYTGATS
ncbi:ABC transporter permease [Actinopolymorpha rutila]|uniref:ABC-2 type transport system permease protein n=1 Tax=Actinopolymorpha rutila TaxID=446787 RepID=A0A852ZL74_9ACTN|nr:ABC-2 family transporter protein [Actinopolymorpha rutila]NYH89146.1 ABC-2 type transport system permease protein [Actinopolymorpha rutila]